MGGVDRNDQLHSYYHVRLKSRKHYKYIFWFLFDLSITNAYILSQYLPEYRGKKLKDFRVTLAQELIGTYTNRKPAITAPSATRVCQLHFPTKASGIYNRCHYCYKYKHEHRSTVGTAATVSTTSAIQATRIVTASASTILGFSAGQQTTKVSKYNCMTSTSIDMDCIDVFHFISASLLTQLHSYLQQANKV